MAGVWATTTSWWRSRELPGELTTEAVSLLCDRHLGVGSDGILLNCRPTGAVEGCRRAHAHLQPRRQRIGDVRQRHAHLRPLPGVARDSLATRSSPSRRSPGPSGRAWWVSMV